MKVPENFKTRIGGNFYAETPNLVVYSDATILRVERDDGGDLHVRLAIYDSSGRRTALVEQHLPENRIEQSDKGKRILNRCFINRWFKLYLY